jgi:hypothetical protein
MAYINSYFELWNTSLEGHRWFRLQVADANHAGFLKLNTFQRNIASNLLEVRAPYKRLVEGVVMIFENDSELPPGELGQYGTLEELLTCITSPSVTEVLMFRDTISWYGKFTMQPRVVDIDPGGRNVMVPIRIEEV